jgi:endonuclease YncB( thermonuclease family)
MAPHTQAHTGPFQFNTASAAILLLMFFGFTIPCHSENFMAQAVGLMDGDTISVLHDGREEVIRLNGIDCPEKNQAYGKKAKNFTSEKVLNKFVTIEAHDVDRDGRIIADVLLPDGTNLNHELVKEGLAWWFFKYSEDETLKALEVEARNEKRGLWRDPIPIPPWVFRKIQRKQVPEISDFQYPSVVRSAVLANKKSMVYRYSGCKKYPDMSDQKNVIPFETIEEAEAEGYHAAKDCPKDAVIR